MKHLTQAVAVAVAGLVISGSTYAMPGFSEQAPARSVDACIARISENANYDHAGRVRHKVDSNARRVGGHAIHVETTVFNEHGTEVIREYATFCAVTDKHETRKFRIREKGV